MRSKRKTALFLALALLLAAALIPASPPAEAAYTPPYTTVRIGIYTYGASGSPSEKTFTSSNLQNVPGCGCGYRLGYFDENRSFVDIGARHAHHSARSTAKDRHTTTAVQAKRSAVSMESLAL